MDCQPAVGHESFTPYVVPEQQRHNQFRGETVTFAFGDLNGQRISFDFVPGDEVYSNWDEVKARYNAFREACIRDIPDTAKNVEEKAAALMEAICSFKVHAPFHLAIRDGDGIVSPYEGVPNVPRTHNIEQNRGKPMNIIDASRLAYDTRQGIS